MRHQLSRPSSVSGTRIVNDRLRALSGEACRIGRLRGGALSSSSVRVCWSLDVTPTEYRPVFTPRVWTFRLESTLKVARHVPERGGGEAPPDSSAPPTSRLRGVIHEGRLHHRADRRQDVEVGVIGYVAAFPIPEVVAGSNSYFLRRPVGEPEHQVKVAGRTPGSIQEKPMRCKGRSSTRAWNMLAQLIDTARRIQQVEGSAGRFGRPVRVHGTLHAPRPSSRPSSTTGPTTMWPRLNQAVLDGTWGSPRTRGAA